MTAQLYSLVAIPALAILLVVCGYIGGRRNGHDKGFTAGYERGHFEGWVQRHEDSTDEERASWRERHPSADYADRDNTSPSNG